MERPGVFMRACLASSYKIPFEETQAKSEVIERRLGVPHRFGGQG